MVTGCPPQTYNEIDDESRKGGGGANGTAHQPAVNVVLQNALLLFLHLCRPQAYVALPPELILPEIVVQGLVNLLVIAIGPRIVLAEVVQAARGRVMS